MIDSLRKRDHNTDSTLPPSAAAGAVIGGVKGGASTDKEKSQVVKNCLRDRGYKILN